MTPRAPAALTLVALGFAAGCTDPSRALETSGLTLSVAALDFGPVAVGTTMAREVRLQNDGAAPADIQEISALPGASPAFGFSLSRTTLPPGGAATLTVDFTPTSPGPAAAIWSLGVSGVAGPALRLSGEGVTPTGHLSVCGGPETLDFGVVWAGATRALSFELCNEGDGDATVTLSGDHATAPCVPGDEDQPFCFTPVGQAPDAEGRITVRAHARQTVEVRFTPRLAGTREVGGVAFRDCEVAACRRTVRLEGIGVDTALSCTPAPLDFGLVFPGDCVDLDVTCRNVTSDRVQIRGWSVSPAAGSPFTPAGSRATALAPDEAVDITVGYCPTTLEAGRAELRIETDVAAPSDVVTVGLAGQPGGGRLEALPADGLSFGLTAVGSPQRRTVLITNVGYSDVSIVEVDPDADATGAFSAPDARPTTLTAGQRLPIEVELAPQRPGPVASRLVLRTDLVDQPELALPLSGEGVTLPPCTFEVAPSRLDFGDLLVQRSLRRDLIVYNRGGGDCLLHGASLGTGSDPDFVLEDAPLNTEILPAGAARRMSVLYRPMTSAAHAGAVGLRLSAGGAPATSVALTGRGVDEGLLVAPNQVDFGPRGAGCRAETRAVRVYNPAATPFTVTSVALMSSGQPAFTLRGAPPLPFTLAPKDALDMQVDFQAPSDGPVEAAIIVSGLLGTTPVSQLVALRGAASATGQHEERFTAPASGELDVLFVLDFTAGMANDRARLADGIHTLIVALDRAGIDYHFGVTTTDTDDEAGRLVHPSDPPRGAFSGGLEGRIITRTDPGGPVARFTLLSQARLDAGGGAPDEAGLFATHQALSPLLLQGHNAGFRRPDAALSVLYLTDEPEQSGSVSAAPYGAVTYYADMLRALVGFDPHRVSAAVIAGPPPTGCNGAGGAAAAAPRLHQLANALGGDTSSICSANGTDMVGAVVDALSVRPRSLHLTAPARPNSVTVRVDGVVVAPGSGTWTLDVGAQRVRFSPFSTPELGSEVTVTYETECL